MNENEPDKRRIEELERRLERAGRVADDAWNIAVGAVFLAVLFRFGPLGVLIGVVVLLLIAKGRRFTRK